MFEELLKTSTEDVQLALPVLSVRLLLALFGGWAVAWLYRWTRDGVGAESLPATLVMLAVLIAAVTQVIGGNMARAFSLVGALSIVRFRTVVRDTRDTAFVIFAVVVGMAMGAGHLVVALVTLFVGGAAAWGMAPSRTGSLFQQEYDLTLKVALGQDLGALEKEAFGELLATWRSRAAATARQGAALEAVWLVTLKAGVAPADVVRGLTRRDGVQSIEVKPAELAF